MRRAVLTLAFDHLGAVRAEDLGPRNQPHRSTRSERRKDGR